MTRAITKRQGVPICRQRNFVPACVLQPVRLSLSLLRSSVPSFSLRFAVLQTKRTAVNSNVLEFFNTLDLGYNLALKNVCVSSNEILLWILFRFVVQLLFRILPIQIRTIKNVSRSLPTNSWVFILDQNFSFGLSNQHRRLLEQNRKVLFVFESKLIGEVCLSESISSDLGFLNNFCFNQIEIYRAISIVGLVSC